MYSFDRGFKSTLRNRSALQRLRPVLKKAQAVGAYLVRVAFGGALIASVLLVWLAIAVLTSSRDGDRWAGGELRAACGCAAGGPAAWRLARLELVGAAEQQSVQQRVQQSVREAAVAVLLHTACCTHQPQPLSPLAPPPRNTPCPSPPSPTGATAAAAAATTAAATTAAAAASGSTPLTSSSGRTPLTRATAASASTRGAR